MSILANTQANIKIYQISANELAKIKVYWILVSRLANIHQTERFRIILEG